MYLKNNKLQIDFLFYFTVTIDFWSTNKQAACVPGIITLYHECKQW